MKRPNRGRRATPSERADGPPHDAGIEIEEFLDLPIIAPEEVIRLASAEHDDAEPKRGGRSPEE